MQGQTEERAAEPQVALHRLPKHVAIIMDGNGRWARSRGISRLAGHRAGTRNVRRVLPAAVDFGIEILTLYAFSTENWYRPRAEVRALLILMKRFIDEDIDDLHKDGVRIRHIGRTEGMDARLVRKIRGAERLTASNDRLILNIAFNYGGRAEIVDAVKRIVAEGLSVGEISEDTIGERLTTGGLPDPDLIIRTGGDMRVSNFLIWQIAYAELYCTPTYWPDFGRDELYKALLAYQQRDRRFGRVQETDS